MIDFVDQDLNGNIEFHFHFLDDSRQDASTIHTHMVNMLTELKNNNQLKVANSIIVVLLYFFNL